MLNIYLTRIKILFNQKIMLWWALAFPIALSVLFYAALSGAYKNNPLDTIPLAIVNGDENFNDALEKIEISDNKKMFDIYYKSESEAKELLNNGTVDAYILYGESIEMVVSESGINQSVIKSVLESFSMINRTIQNIMVLNGGSINIPDIENINTATSYVEYSDKMTKQPDLILNYFYSLIAMACLFAAMYGVKEITEIQANLSPTAARINMTGVPKYKFILASLSASYTIQVIICFVLLAFLRFVLNINFGDRILLVLATCLLSCLFGLFMGAFIGSVSKKDLDVKSSIVTAFSLIGCFLSGLMVANMKFIVATTLPILSYINPANLISDALYSLYYYEELDRYLLNMIILGAFTLILATLTYFLTRRSKYASI